MRFFPKPGVSTLLFAAALAAAVASVPSVPANAGQYIDGHYVHADQFGNLVIQKPGGYKQIIVGQGHVLKTYKPAVEAPEPDVNDPGIIYRNRMYRDRDEYDDGELEEHSFVLRGKNDNAECVGGAIVLRGRSFMYGVPRGVTPIIEGVC